MKFTYSNFPFLIIIYALILNTSCTKKGVNEVSKLDFKTYDLNLHIDSLLNGGGYIYLEHSPITNSSFYYSYNTSLFQFAGISLEGDSLTKTMKIKPNALDDVFDWDEVVNRIEIFPSTENTIDAIILTIEEPNSAKEIIKYFADKNRVEESDKIYLLHTEKKYINEDKQDVIYLSIIRKEAKVIDTNMIDLIDSYYKK